MNGEFDRSINLLGVDEVHEYKEDILHLLDRACVSLDNYGATLEAQTIFDALTKQQAFVIGGFSDNKLEIILVFQMQQTESAMFANIIAVAGKNMMTYKRLFLGVIHDWFKEFGAQAIQLMATDRLAKVYRRMGYHKAYNVLYTKL